MAIIIIIIYIIIIFEIIPYLCVWNRVKYIKLWYFNKNNIKIINKGILEILPEISYEIRSPKIKNMHLQFWKTEQAHSGYMNDLGGIKYSTFINSKTNRLCHVYWLYYKPLNDKIKKLIQEYENGPRSSIG